jgi:hypothetical protein
MRVANFVFQKMKIIGATFVALVVTTSAWAQPESNTSATSTNDSSIAQVVAYDTQGKPVFMKLAGDGTAKVYTVEADGTETPYKAPLNYGGGYGGGYPGSYGGYGGGYGGYGSGFGTGTNYPSGGGLNTADAAKLADYYKQQQALFKQQQQSVLVPKLLPSSNKNTSKEHQLKLSPDEIAGASLHGNTHDVGLENSGDYVHGSGQSSSSVGADNSQGSSKDHQAAQDQADAKSAETFVEGLGTCVESIKRGLTYFTESKKKYDGVRDYVSGTMAKVDLSKQELPPQIGKMLSPRSIQSVDEMRDIESALHMLKAFAGDPSKADGPAYRKEAMVACNKAKSEATNLSDAQKMKTFQKEAYKVVAGDNARANLSVMQINAKWAMLKSPTKEDYSKAMKTLDQYGGDYFEEHAYKAINKDGLSPTEFQGLRYYTGSGYSQINPILRSPDTAENVAKLPQVRAVIDGTNAGLTKLPNYIGTVNRGASLPDSVLAQHTVGAVVEYPSYTSTSTENGFGGAHRFVIQSYTGKYVDSYSTCKGEQEVLFRPGAKFRILHIEENDTKPANSWDENPSKIFYMEEVAE